MTDRNPGTGPASAGPSRVCSLCGRGPKLPQCTAAVHRMEQVRETYREPSPITQGIEQVSSRISTVTPKLSPDLSDLQEIDAHYRIVKEDLDLLAQRRSEAARAAREAGASLGEIASVLEVTRATVQGLVKDRTI